MDEIERAYRLRGEMVMTQQNVVQIKDKAPQHALDSLNRVTGLTWNSLPKSLVSGVQVMNQATQQAYAPERKRA